MTFSFEKALFITVDFTRSDEIAYLNYSKRRGCTIHTNKLPGVVGCTDTLKKK